MTPDNAFLICQFPTSLIWKLNLGSQKRHYASGIDIIVREVHILCFMHISLTKLSISKNLSTENILMRSVYCSTNFRDSLQN
jgi:hypothetical protein